MIHLGKIMSKIQLFTVYVVQNYVLVTFTYFVYTSIDVSLINIE